MIKKPQTILGKSREARLIFKVYTLWNLRRGHNEGQIQTN
jgi:hypothetical protein